MHGALFATSSVLTNSASVEHVAPQVEPLVVKLLPLTPVVMGVVTPLSALSGQFPPLGLQLRYLLAAAELFLPNTGRDVPIARETIN